MHSRDSLHSGSSESATDTYTVQLYTAVRVDSGSQKGHLELLLLLLIDSQCLLEANVASLSTTGTAVLKEKL